MSYPPSAAEPTTQHRVDRWFTRRGVPTFAEKYPVSELLLVLMAPLLVVTAAQLATLLLDLEAWHIAIGPAVVTLLALPVLPTLQWMLDPRPEEDRPTPRAWPLILALGGAGAVVAVLRATGDDDAMVAEVAVNLAVLLLSLVACVILLRPEVWVCEGKRDNFLQWTMFAVLVAAVVAFGLEGMPVAPFDARALGVVSASTPPALPALPIVLLLAFLAVLMSKGAHAGEIGREWPGDRREALLAISPVLVLLLGVETTLLPTTQRDWVEALVPLALLILFLGLALAWPVKWSWYRRASQLRRQASDRNPPLLILLLFAIPTYLFVYPALADLADRASFEAAASINLFYLVVAGIGVAFGVDRMAVWATRKLFKTYRQILLGIARGLPLLLFFTAFFLFTTELWQAAEAMPDWAFLTLVGSVVGITVLFLLIVALTDLKRHSDFVSWADVRTAVLRLDADRPTGAETAPASACPVEPDAGRTKEDDDIEDLRRLLAEASLIDEDNAARCNNRLKPLKLSLRRRLSVLGVIGVYQALIFIPLFVTAFGVFLGAGLLAVRNPLLDNWINGDQGPGIPRDPENFFDGSFFTWPWTRVAFFLAAFSILYVAVDILRSPDMRAQFFAGADDGVRQRLAVRKVYEERLPQWSQKTTPDATPPSKRSRRRVGTGRARRAEPSRTG